MPPTSESALAQIVQIWRMVLHESVSFFEREEYERLAALLEPARAELAAIMPKVANVDPPPYRTAVLVWYPPAKMWVVGMLHQGQDKFGDFFHNYGCGAWYLIDGPTAWMPLPKAPNLNEVN